jgi:hypothetical protein
MGHLSGDAIVLTENGCKTIHDLYNETNRDIYIIVNGEKHKCSGIKYCGETNLVKVSFRNGMDILVDPTQEFVDKHGHLVSIQVASLPNEHHKLVNIALNNISLFVWNNGIGTYEEGYIIALLTQSCYYGTEHNNPTHNYIKLKISKSIRNHEMYYSYSLIKDYFKNNKETLAISMHMETDDWIIYRFSSPHFQRILNKFSICTHGRNIYEKGSYDFTQGYLRAIFDLKAEIMKDDYNQIFIRLKYNDEAYLKSVQRLLYHMGIPCRIGNETLHITSKQDISKFHFIIGFGVEDKYVHSSLDNTQSHSRHGKRQTNEHHYWSCIKEITEVKQKTSSYDVEIEGGVIAVNGILLKA